TFTQSPTIYIPSSPDYARAVSAGIAWGLIPEAQCAEELASGHLVKLAATPVEFPLYWQRWNINSPVMETVTRRVHEAARGDLIY
ncbi:MAG: transcriptional regulator ArgP, partial [Rothia sp.]|nr:transcriptional regulator ArgP [Rothia sp. (in: high G+C Gram-positive bacteria)]